MSNKISTGFGHASLYGGFGNTAENWSDEEDEDEDEEEGEQVEDIWRREILASNFLSIFRLKYP